MAQAHAVAVPTGRSESLWLRSMRRLLRKPKAVFALVVIAILYGSGLFAHWVAPYGYNQQDLTAVRQPPSARHWLGTDGVGRDILSRIIYALRTNLIITAAAVLTGSMLLGITLGLLSGYLGGKVDSVIMRIGELFTAFPGILLVILLAATLKPRVLEMVRDFEDATGIRGLVRWGIVDYFVVFGALAAFSWIGMARLVRGQVLYLKEQAFVESARAAGASLWRILLVHILPNALPPVIVSISMGLGAIAGAEVVLSWLGIGIQPPVPSLGNMIWEGQSISVLQRWPHMLLPPVITVALLIFAWNLLGDALNDVLNPKAR
ncbi:MAG: ABC transporter permease [Dehalococcoidia bacterium]|nr:ABC transporter permease [Dehalococcoidia bacterium]MDW8120087.1 ABC transporter permease [Chloroflexota bacterium]